MLELFDADEELDCEEFNREAGREVEEQTEDGCGKTGGKSYEEMSGNMFYMWEYYQIKGHCEYFFNRNLNQF